MPVRASISKRPPYLLARYFDPAIVRFSRRGHIGNPTQDGVGTNLYNYAGNDPVNKSDPNGHVAGAVAQGAKSLGSMIGSFFSEVASIFSGGSGAGRALASGAGSYLGSAAGGVTLAVSIVLTPTETVRNDQFCRSLCSESERLKGETAKLGPADRNGTAATPPDPDDDGERDKKDAELSAEKQRAIRSLEKRIEEHEKKLADFKANPTVRPGMENQPQSVIDKQWNARINHLETEIRTFKNNIGKIREGR